ncbi:GMC family oxidoreductase [Streptomyces samsunensis]|uniref:GMC family oxidoreductase n=1 Tax=Streptomyces malaysiensis TaxID=92644 RepID=UPI001581F049|nr:GMC family oxidoreductase [Streptomyces samsunensis]NUH40165.1 GMC family oxidoreductase [Streptomyces samsunensis]
MTLRRGTYDATEYAGTSRDIADVLIIGSGPSGATYAKYLSSWGFHVVCLEQGPWVGTAEYTGDRDAYEVSMFGRWSKDGNVRRLPQDYPCELSESDIIPVMYNAVGGGSIHYGAQWPRLLPGDFRVRTLDGVADDWPLTYEDLVPHYERNDIDFAVSGMGGDPAYPDGAAPPMPALPINAYGRRLAQGMNRLGWSWWPAPNAIAQKNTQGLVPCVRYGTCEAGCPNGSKSSADITHWPVALKQGATLITGARVREISVDDKGLASGAIFLDTNGVEHHIRARVVVMAANGVGTARLLQLSTSARFPQGLANSSGLVGRNLMLHPTAMAVGVYDDPLDSWRGPAGQNIHSYEFYETDTARGFVRGAKWISMPSGGPLVASTLVPHGPTGAHGAELLQDVKDVLGHSLLLIVLSEDLPNPDNRVDLDPKLTDSSGIPAPRITYRRDQNNINLVNWHLARAREALEASGARQVHLHDVMPDQPGHLLGTARMGDDPETSVVDSFGKSHDVPNLYIADGSVFVTSGGVNPTNTIAALALRGATEMVRRAAEQEVA